MISRRVLTLCLLLAGAGPVQAFAQVQEHGQVQPSNQAPEPGPVQGGAQVEDRATQHRQVGLFPGESVDTDADGVADIDDNCPVTPVHTATPRGMQRTEVDHCGCPVDVCARDADGDGVGDCLDDCARTHGGLAVLPTGCPAPLARALRVTLDVKFAFDRAEIDLAYTADLERLRDVLLRYPDLHVQLRGHTDFRGAEAYNQRLSERRAQAARDFMLAGGGIDGARIEALGLGEGMPLASNDTEQGQALNRRTEADLQFEQVIVPANDEPPPLAGLEP